MGTVLLVLVVVLVVAALVFGVVSMLSGDDPGLSPAEPDSRAVALPNNRSLTEADIKGIRFELALRGYRMSQVDRALRRTAYDIGYKDEMIAVLEAEVAALREGRLEDADLLRKAREAAANPTPGEAAPASAAAVEVETATGPPDDAQGGVTQGGVTQGGVTQGGDVVQGDVVQSDVANGAEAGNVSAELVAGAAPVDSGETAETAEAAGDGDAGDGSDAEDSVERARG